MKTERFCLAGLYVAVLILSWAAADLKQSIRELQKRQDKQDIVLMENAELKVGDEVQPFFTPRFGKIAAMDGDKVWVRTEKSTGVGDTIYNRKELTKVVRK